MEKTSAKRYLERIDANVDAFYAGRISYETFTMNQLKAWKEIQARPRIDSLVMSKIRDRLA